MTDETALENLLDRWERSYRNHEQTELSELCRDYPHLLEKLSQRVNAIIAVEAALRQHDLTSPPPGQKPGSTHFVAAPEEPIVKMEALYQVVRHHAAGGLGEVLLAWDDRIGRAVAVKRLQRARMHDSASRRRFLREAEITGQLDHPGIVPMLTVGQDPRGAPCYAMKFIEGETLAESVRTAHARYREALGTRRGDRREFERLVLRPLLTRFVTVCNTLAYAHERGILHRDLKPGNMMLGNFGATYVVDWGLAKRLGSPAPPTVPSAECPTPVEGPSTQGQDETLKLSESPTDADVDELLHLTLTQTGAVAGTPAFMSPEQAAGEMHSAGASSDIYSLGATLYFLLTSRPSIISDPDLNWLQQLKSGTFPRPAALCPAVPPQLEAVCMKAMALRPENRYSSAVELAADVDRWMADEPVSACSESLRTRLARWSRRHRAWTQAAVLSLAIITFLTVMFAVQLDARRQEAESARAKSSQLAEEKSRLADEKSRLAGQEAEAKRIADEQGNLAISTLRSVIFQVARNLKNVEGAAEVRTQLLTAAVEGLGKVSSTLNSRAEIDRNLMFAHVDLGKIYLTAGNLEKFNSTAAALEHFRKSITIGQSLLDKNPADDPLERNISVVFELSGDACLQLGNLDDADKAYAESLAISERRLLRKPNDVTRRQDTGFGYEKVGDVLLTRGNRTDAAQHFQRSLELYQQIVNDEPTIPSHRRDLLVAKSKLGNIQRQDGKLTEAAETFRECVRICEVLEQLPGSGSQRRDRSVLLNKLGTVLYDQGNHTAACDVFSAGLQIARDAVTAEPQSVTARRDLSVSLKYLADSRKQLGSFDDSRALYDECAALRKALAAEDLSSQVAQTDVAAILADIADLDLLSAKPDAARVRLDEAAAILQSLKEAQKLEGADDQQLLERVLELQSRLPR